MLIPRARVYPVVAIAVATALSLTACARKPDANGRIRQSSDVVTRAELTRSRTQTAYDAIVMLRPTFFTSRGPTSIMQRQTLTPVVYLDNARLGDIDALRALPLEGIFEIRFISATQAQHRWGMNHPAGAILVVSATARPAQGT